MKEPKKIPIIDEDEYIDCPKCSKNFKIWRTNIKYIEESNYGMVNVKEYMIIFCPRCSYITKRRPLDWNTEE